MAEEITLPRTGDRPLAFTGELLAQEETKWWAGKESNRWHKLALYRTAGDRWVLAIGYRTQWEGEVDHDEVFVCATAEEAAECLRSTIPTEHLRGFPPGDQWAEKQSRLERDMTDRFLAAASRILKELGPERID